MYHLEVQDVQRTGSVLVLVVVDVTVAQGSLGYVVAENSDGRNRPYGRERLEEMDLRCCGVWKRKLATVILVFDRYLLYIFHG